MVSLFLSSTPIIVGTSFALYYSLGQDQEFFNALDTLLVTAIMMLLMLLDLRHPYNYFIDELETQNIKNKIYREESEQLERKEDDRAMMEDLEKGSNISRENLLEAGNALNSLDNMQTAKKFRPAPDRI